METQNMQNNMEQKNTTNPYINNQNMQNNINAQSNANSFLGSFSNAEFIKGALIGAAVGYLLTNEKAQKTIMKTLAKGTEIFQMGVEEIKERFEDVKAEMASK